MKKYNLLVGFIGLIVLIAGLSVAGWFMLRPEPLILQGEIEATEVRVSGKVPGRISEFYVSEGTQVSKGDTLLLLDSPELLAKLEQAQAAVAAAEAQNRKAIGGTRSEQIAAAYEMWQKAEVGTDIARKSFIRVQNLYAKEVVTTQQRDEAEAQYNAATATAKAAKAQYDMALNGAQAEDKQAALAMVNRAKGARDEVESYLREIRLTSPVAGEVSELYPKAGELVGTGTPILSILRLDDVWATFNIREDLLPGFSIGKELKVSIPALGNRTLTFKVTYIKSLGSYATWKATKATGEFDVKTFEVRAKPVEDVEGLRPGMSALYQIEKLKN
ncbi:MAG: efflux RND transporter periplasmic adaptor subunit [Bacteroidales bacterium]|jgi:HlyD family secretion protein|nr:efflux RND transporter periplasmic adaptor subunit [Bacteroidales bacterium]